MKIVLIGSGNVATHLSRVMKSSGYKILQVYSRSLSNAKKLAQSVSAEYTNDLGCIRKDSDIYFFCVTDSILPELAKKVNFGNKLAVHTSGTVEINVLNGVSKNYGVFYPMQTFSKQLNIDFKSTSIFIEANTLLNEKVLLKMAAQLNGGKNIYRMNSTQRKTVHISAVFANNFANHFYVIAEELLKKQKLSFDILRPLILETAKKIQSNDPAKMQTGPAKRNDQKVIKEQLQLLDKYPEYKKLYELLSKSISAKHNPENN